MTASERPLLRFGRQPESAGRGAACGPGSGLGYPDVTNADLSTAPGMASYLSLCPINGGNHTRLLSRLPRVL